MASDLLEDALRVIAAGEIGSVAGLATRLEVSRALATQMLEDLARRGYLELDPLGCAGTCEGCPEVRSCSLASQARLWTLTPKALALLGG